MSQIVFAAGIRMSKKAAPEQSSNIAIQRMLENWIVTAKPDVVIIFGNDTEEEAAKKTRTSPFGLTVALHATAKYGGLQQTKPVDRDMAEALRTGLVCKHGVEMESFAESDPLDPAFFTPFGCVGQIPVIPFHLNTANRLLANPDNCQGFGYAVGQLVKRCYPTERTAVIATDFSDPESGHLNWLTLLSMIGHDADIQDNQAGLVRFI